MADIVGMRVIDPMEQNIVFRNSALHQKATTGKKRWSKCVVMWVGDCHAAISAGL